MLALGRRCVPRVDTMCCHRRESPSWCPPFETGHFSHTRCPQTAGTMAVHQLPLETRSLLLRHFVLEDVVAVHALSDEETSRTWLPSQVYRDRAHACSVLESLIGHYSTPGNPTQGPYVLAIEYRTDGALIGHVGFSPWDNEVEIGFSIAQRRQRQGLATEAIGAASRWVFKTF